ncbi:MAG: hypothetical protein ACLSHJ_12035 [Oscillospiraceae bacterium]
MREMQKAARRADGPARRPRRAGGRGRARRLHGGRDGGGARGKGGSKAAGEKAEHVAAVDADGGLRGDRRARGGGNDPANGNEAGSNASAAPDTPAAQEDQAMFSMAAPPSDPLPDTDAEVEYPEQRCETVQSSPYYDRQLGGAAADGFKTANAPADLENGSPEAEYYCETAPIGESGEEGSLLTAWYGPVVLELYGAGATDYVTENGGVKAGDAGCLLCSHRRAARAAGGAFHDGRAGGSAHARSCRRGVGNRLPR